MLEDVPETLEAPIKKEQVIGTFKLMYDGEVLGSGNLVLTGGVDRDELVFMLQNIKEFIQSMNTSPFLRILHSNVSLSVGHHVEKASLMATSVRWPFPVAASEP